MQRLRRGPSRTLSRPAGAITLPGAKILGGAETVYQNAPTLAFWLRSSKIAVLGLTVGEITFPALVKNQGHDVLARSARTPVLSAMSALNASAQRGQDDMRGFAERARLEMHHPAKHSALLSW